MYPKPPVCVTNNLKSLIFESNKPSAKMPIPIDRYYERAEGKNVFCKKSKKEKDRQMKKQRNCER
jgi:hypothetical protein